MALDNIAPEGASENVFLSKNRIEINIDPAPLSINDRTGLRYFLKLYVAPYLNASLADFIELPEMEAVEEPLEQLGSVSIAKGAYFEISEILDSVLETKTPNFNQNKIVINPNVVKQFRYDTRIENNGVNVANSVGKTETVYRGGINNKDLDGYIADGKTTVFGNFFKNGNKFLTYSPVTKVLPNAPIFLSYFVARIPRPSKLKLRLHAQYYDGTSDSTATTINIANNVTKAVYVVNVGPLALGLINRSKKVKTYKIWLNNENDLIVSDVQNYEIDWEDYVEERFVVFRNSLSAYDTLQCVGKIEESINIVREVFEREKVFGSVASYSEKVTNKVTAERQLKVNTGWLNNTQRKWLEELALSEEVLLLTKTGFVPVTLLDSSYVNEVSNEDLIGRSFVFKYNNIERNFSDLPILPAEDFGDVAWRPYNYGACELNSFNKRTGKRVVTHLEMYYVSSGLAVKPATIKLNIPDEAGYVAPITSGLCSTNFLNTELIEQGSYRKSGCTNGLQGSFATLTMPAGTYGSEVSVDDANATALAVLLLSDTQAYADANGQCNVAPWAYNLVVPANRLNVRWVMDNFYSDVIMAGGLGAYSGQGSHEVYGNHWLANSTSNVDSIFYEPANNLDMLLKATPSLDYFIDTPRPITIKVYKNGNLDGTYVLNQNEIDLAGGYKRQFLANSEQWVVQDKIYIAIS